MLDLGVLVVTSFQGFLTKSSSQLNKTGFVAAPPTEGSSTKWSLRGWVFQLCWPVLAERCWAVALKQPGIQVSSPQQEIRCRNRASLPSPLSSRPARCEHSLESEQMAFHDSSAIQLEPPAVLEGTAQTLPPRVDRRHVVKVIKIQHSAHTFWFVVIGARGGAAHSRSSVGIRHIFKPCENVGVFAGRDDRPDVQFECNS